MNGRYRVTRGYCHYRAKPAEQRIDAQLNGAFAIARYRRKYALDLVQRRHLGHTCNCRPNAAAACSSLVCDSASTGFAGLTRPMRHSCRRGVGRAGSEHSRRPVVA